MGYLRAHWRGELSLAVSYWINGVALNVALYISIIMLQPVFDRLPLDKVLIVIVSVTVFELTVAIWQFVGIWRSATNSADRSGSNVWPTLAKLSVIIGVLRTVVMLVTSAQDIGTVAERVEDPALQDYQVETIGGINVLLQGAITNESVDQVLAALADPNIELLRVNSHGGLLVPALRLGRHIRQFDIQVMVDGECTSACVFILAASPDAVIVLGSTVTFHRVDDSGEFANPEFQRVAREAKMEEDSFLRDMGIPPWAMLAASQQEFWTPTLGQLVEMGLIQWVYLPSIGDYVAADEYCRLNVVVCFSE